MKLKDIHIFDYAKIRGNFYSQVFRDHYQDPYEVAVIKGFPNSNAEILSLANAIGYITAGRKIITNSENAEQYIAEVRYKADVVIDKDGMNVYSETNSNIDLHTDCSYLVDIPPPDYILLYVEKQSNDGGESVIINLDELMLQLHPDMFENLRKPIFPFRFGLAPILFELNNQKCIRYNYDLLQKSIADKVFLSEIVVEQIIDNFQDFLNNFDEKLIFKLSDGDMLIINNHKNLHGRGNFDKYDQRILRRLRVTSYNLLNADKGEN